MGIIIVQIDMKYKIIQMEYSRKGEIYITIFVSITNTDGCKQSSELTVFNFNDEAVIYKIKNLYISIIRV